MISRVYKKIVKFLPAKKINNFIFIIGAQKGGTTSLHAYLEQHPKIISASKKELGFFSKDGIYEKGLPFYLQQFPKYQFAKYALDSTPEYAYYRNAPKRINKFCPNAKIVFLLREPISRAFSAYNMYKILTGNVDFQSALESASKETREYYSDIANGSLDPDIEYFIDREMEMIGSITDLEEPALVRRGLYYPQLKRYIDLFGRENVLVLFSEELSKKTLATVNKVFSFLELPILATIDLEHKHRRDYIVDLKAREYIEKKANHLFKKDKENLMNNLNLKVPW